MCEHRGGHHHRENLSPVEQEERAVTRWLNTMEVSLADSSRPFSIADFSPREIQSVNRYIATHQNNLGRYQQFLPRAEVS
jgi:hypothetical protein